MGDWKGFSEEEIKWVANYLGVSEDELKVDAAEQLILEILAEKKKAAKTYWAREDRGKSSPDPDSSSSEPSPSELLSPEFFDLLGQDPSIRDLTGELSQLVRTGSGSHAAGSHVAYSLQELIQLNERSQRTPQRQWSDLGRLRAVDLKSNWGVDYKVELFRQVARRIESMHDNDENHGGIDPTVIKILREAADTWPSLGRLAGRVAVAREKQSKGQAQISRYTAPEQLEGNLDKKTAKPADIFRLGAVMYETFTGKPFIEETEEAAIETRIKGLAQKRPALAHEVNPEVPPELGHIIHKATEPSVSKRFRKISELHESLDRFQRGKPLVGATIDSKYILESVLGSGGQGTVYLAVQIPFSILGGSSTESSTPRHVETRKKYVAVKFVEGTDPTLVNAFKQESFTTGQMNHSNIVQATDAGPYNDTHYLVLEVLGSSLRSRMVRGEKPKKSGTLYRGNSVDSWGIDYLIKMFEVLADALDHMHSKDVTHRDIKPENIMFKNHGTGEPVPLGELQNRVVFTDLGLAMFGAKKDKDQTVSGTPVYFALEQAKKTRVLREILLIEGDIERKIARLEAIPGELRELETALMESEEMWKESHREDIERVQKEQIELPDQIASAKSLLPKLEAVRDALQLDNKKIDISQLGAVMYEAFAGRRYIQSPDDYLSIEEAILETEKIPPSAACDVNHEVPREISEIISRALAPADRRYGSAKEIADDLRRYQKDHALSFERDPRIRVRKWVRRNARALKVGTGVVAVIATLGAYIVQKEIKEARIEAEIVQRRESAKSVYNTVLREYTSMMGTLPEDPAELEARLIEMESLGIQVASTRDDNRGALDDQQVAQLNQMADQLTSRRSDVERGMTRSRMLSRYGVVMSQCGVLLTQEVTLEDDDLESYDSSIAQARVQWERLSDERDASTLTDQERQAMLQGLTRLSSRARQLRLGQYEGSLSELRQRIDEPDLASAAYEPLSRDLADLERRIRGLRVEGEPEPQALSLISQLGDKLLNNQSAARNREEQSRVLADRQGVSDERYRQARVACTRLIGGIELVDDLAPLTGGLVVTADVPRGADLQSLMANLGDARAVLEQARDSARAYQEITGVAAVEARSAADARVREIDGAYARVQARQEFITFITRQRDQAQQRLSEADVAQAGGNFKQALWLVVQAYGLDTQDTLQVRLDQLNELDRAQEQAVGIQGLTSVSEAFGPLYSLHFSYRIAEFAGSESEYHAQRDRILEGVRSRINELTVPSATKDTLCSILIAINQEAYDQAHARSQSSGNDAIRDTNVLRNMVRYVQEALGEEYIDGGLGDRQTYDRILQDMRRALIQNEQPADAQDLARLNSWRTQGRALYDAVSSGRQAREETDLIFINSVREAYSLPQPQR